MGTVHLSILIHDLVLIFLSVLVLILIMMCAVLFYGFYQYKSLKNKRGWESLIDSRVSSAIVFSDEEEVPESEFFHSHSQEGSFRNLLLKKLVSSKKKFSGVAQDEIQRLFVNYELNKEAVQNLNSTKPYIIAGGIQEVTAMKMTDSLPQVEKYLTHPSAQVYNEAQYAMVVFKGFSGLAFLNTLDTALSDWQQLRLLGSLQMIPNDTDLCVELWLKSSNLSVVIFTLKLIQKFQMLALYDQVKGLLYHASEKVRLNAVLTLQVLENDRTKDDFMEAYPLQPVKVQLAILRAMKYSNDKRYYDFFMTQLNNQPIVALKIEAAKALLALGFSESLKETVHSKAVSEQIREIVKHVLQQKI